MKQKLSIGVLESRRDAKLKLISEAGPMIQGSLATIRVTCGNPNCKCARGEKHVSHILNKKVRGKSKSLYIPKDMVEQVREWVNENRRVKKLMKEVSDLNEQIVRSYVPTKKSRAKNLANAEKVLRES